MTSPITFSRLAFGTGVAAAGIYGALIYRRLYQHGSVSIKAMDYDVPASFKNSKTMQQVVNPQHHPLSVMDTRYGQLRIPDSHSNITDEKLLAHFIRGFFGSYVFGPERLIANNLLPSLPRITAFSATQDVSAPVAASSKADMPSEKLLPLHSRICDLFQVTDLYLAGERDQPSQRSESYIDFAFGSDGSRFSGAHRFSVIRDREDAEHVTISFASTVCNPQTGKNIIPPGGGLFHRLYAMLLFKDGIAEVQHELLK